MTDRSPSTVLALDAQTRRAEPFPRGNDLSLRHGFYSSLTRDEDRAQVDSIADVLRAAVEALGVETTPFEPLVQVAAGRVLLRDRGYAEVLSKGVADVAPSLLRDLMTLEARVDSAFAALGLTTSSAAEIASRLGRGRDRSGGFDASRLSPVELEQLRVLVVKGTP